MSIPQLPYSIELSITSFVNLKTIYNVVENHIDVFGGKPLVISAQVALHVSTCDTRLCADVHDARQRYFFSPKSFCALNMEEPDSDANATRLEIVYRTFIGKAEAMDSRTWVKLLKETKALDKSFTVTDADLIFAKFKTGKTLTFSQFVEVRTEFVLDISTFLHTTCGAFFSISC